MRVIFRGLLLILVATCSGCWSGGDTGGRVAVSGRITLDGTPVDEGRVTFIPQGDSDNPGAAGPVKAGEFAIPATEGPRPGDYLARITLGTLRREDFNGEAQTRFETPVTISADMPAGLNIDLTRPPSRPRRTR